MKAEGKCDNKEQNDDGELEECVQHINDHQDVYPEEGNLSDAVKEVDPGGGDRVGCKLPLPPTPNSGPRLTRVEVNGAQGCRDVARCFQSVIRVI